MEPDYKDPSLLFEGEKQAPGQHPAMNSSRVTDIRQIYFQGAETQPEVLCDMREVTLLCSDETVYRRTINLDSEWKKLDTGWVQEPSLIILRNEEGSVQHTIPTDLEREALQARTVEIAVLHAPTSKERNRDMHSPPRQEPVLIPTLRLPPRDSQPLRPIDPDSLYIRAGSGRVRCTIVAVPK